MPNQSEKESAETGKGVLRVPCALLQGLGNEAHRTVAYSIYARCKSNKIPAFMRLHSFAS